MGRGKDAINILQNIGQPPRQRKMWPKMPLSSAPPSRLCGVQAESPSHGQPPGQAAAMSDLAGRVAPDSDQLLKAGYLLLRGGQSHPWSHFPCGLGNVFTAPVDSTPCGTALQGCVDDLGLCNRAAQCVRGEPGLSLPVTG